MAHAPQQRWFWAPLMERGEVLLIKGWDSLDDGRAKFTPHGAFHIPGETAGESAGETAAPPTRESIEVRAYLVYGGYGRLAHPATPVQGHGPKAP